MYSRKHRRFVAWLAVAAVWLSIVAPVVSRSLPAAWTSLGHSAHHGEHGGHEHHPAPVPPHDHQLDRCDYCGLLSDSPTLIGGAWLPRILPAVATEPAVVPDVLPWIRHASLAAAPRGPPSFAHA